LYAANMIVRASSHRLMIWVGVAFLSSYLCPLANAKPKNIRDCFGLEGEQRASEQRRATANRPTTYTDQSLPKVVIETKLRSKEIDKLPPQVRDAYNEWIERLQTLGLYEVRRDFGGKYHDEGLRGDRAGQRSVRLNQQWPVIYEQRSDSRINVVEIIPHSY
jgi:plasmid maintenance system killer protein